ncbi:MAG: glutathione S-transferase C-terminal domain-containing protein [Myxococcota bacterium]
MRLPTAWGIRNASPFNMKAEALLKMAGLSYDAVEALPQKGPKGKMPTLIDGDQVIGDSSFIQRHLDALAARLQTGPFFFGEQIRSIDAALFSQIVNVIDPPYDTPVRAHARKQSVLVDYARRCDEAIFKRA